MTMLVIWGRVIQVGVIHESPLPDLPLRFI